MKKPSPARYHTTNWSGYDLSLRKRGSLLIWPDKERSGRPSGFSDAAIQRCLSVKVLFNLPLMQTAGMIARVLRLAGLDWPCLTIPP